MKKKRTKTLSKSFSILDVLRRVCAAHDFVFLSRQLTYHIAANAEQRQVLGNENKIEAILSELIAYIARHTPYGNNINIEIREVAKRKGVAVEVLFKTTDEQMLDKKNLIKPASIFLACKEAISQEGGELTVDLPEIKRPTFKLILRTMASASGPEGDQQIFKYDIEIKNIANVRKRFGIKKSLFLVSQIENFVRSIVRHPIDIVTALPSKGIITAIYETPKGAAQSVAGRISARLGGEKFLIGKMVIDLDLSYHLSSLPSPSVKRAIEN